MLRQLIARSTEHMVHICIYTFNVDKTMQIQAVYIVRFFLWSLQWKSSGDHGQHQKTEVNKNIFQIKHENVFNPCEKKINGIQQMFGYPHSSK